MKSVCHSTSDSTSCCICQGHTLDVVGRCPEAPPAREDQCTDYHGHCVKDAGHETHCGDTRDSEER